MTSADLKLVNELVTLSSNPHDAHFLITYMLVKKSKSRKIIDHICGQFKIKIEVRRLPVGDGIWIARHKHLASEYVLDFIVERKNVDDLRCSIRDNRYRDQKVRLLGCLLELSCKSKAVWDLIVPDFRNDWLDASDSTCLRIKVGVDVPESTLEDSDGWEWVEDTGMVRIKKVPRSALGGEG
ncbi:hypothetical protein RJ640_027492 [Escallonia rubra]|uniref:Crossover junction endonuclease MUS81 n=1 Tax=Escallonia rubra TaxID=112253 RepID=A0AA88UBR9_9ASTE|nr:hypothetical protein RJ640_027492 [Escallonia rubra]